ncbi:SET domain-containing protein [Ophiobolus disseminans]|uniref:SET domain-containing protein n=1 Tax=Ophiobolus disseminans TaxID=1469910 RepID=A0A6A7AEZ9_9PLEO|nr:SET domain-containing protein [Ophiobolus disseminans]
MARSEPVRNTYEEFADEMKQLMEDSKNKRGQIPKSRQMRDALIQDHEWHLRFLHEGVLQPRNFILPPPYAPAQLEFSKARRVHIKDLGISSRNSEEAILLRTLTDPYVYSSSITIVEDEHGDTARLTVCNLEDSMDDPVLSKGLVLAVKQPCWTAAPEAGYHIRVDHPSDLVILESDNDRLPEAWRTRVGVEGTRTVTKFKQEGDMLFLKKKFRSALEKYEQGRLLLTASSDTVAQVDIYRKRCGVNVVLLRFDDAAEDLAQAISIHALSDSAVEKFEVTTPSAVREWLHNGSKDDSLQMASILPRSLKDLAARIKFDLGLYQTSPDYDLPTISAYVGPLTLHVDAANYLSDVEIKPTSYHGRGLFAKRDFQAGDLLMAEKAFALPGYFFNDRSSDCALYSLGDGTATDRAGALLFKELVQKLTANPSLRKGFFDMDDGGYWAKNGWEVSEQDDIPVDVFRIEHIRRRNCFAAPLRAVDVLTTPTSVRNGFWIHTSYLNHACLPNSVRTFLGDILFLRATRDISAGEEITSQYVVPELTIADRQQKYKETWGFECDCRLCRADSDVGVEVERERMRLFEELKATAQKLGSKPTVTALKKFARRLRDLEVIYSKEAYEHLPKLCLVHPTIFLAEAWRGLNNVEKTIEYSTRLLRYFGITIQVDGNVFSVLENCGLINVECVRALKYLAEGYKSKNQLETASSVTSTAQVWYRIITGADLGSKEFLQ